MHPQFIPTPQDVQRFWAKVDRSGGIDACWAWQASKLHTGYGRFRLPDRTIGAHRASYIIHNGAIPDGLFVCHTCDNRACVNPSHLFLGTNTDNQLDALSKNRLHPPRGEGHYKSKLTEADVRAIRQRYAEGGITQYALADQYGVPQSSIGLIVRRKSWAHVK